MRSLPKSLKPRNRYLFFEVETYPNVSISEDDLQRHIWFESQNLFGDLVSSETRSELIEFDGTIGILRCSHDKVKETRAALACVNDVNGETVGIVVLGVSGTIKSGKEKYIRDREMLETTLDGRRAWQRDEKIDVLDEDRSGNAPGKQKSNTDGEPRFVGATIYDFE
ncbi:MAG: Rpp14/Pop5 family protein [Halobacteria archaeon]|nr:Rpp14/Pop5 family protein [Halobacteria archaeon]